MKNENLSQILEISSIFRIFLALFLKISRQFLISWTFQWNSRKNSSNFSRKIAKFIEKREWKMKFHFHSAKILDGFLLKFWDLSGAKVWKSCRISKNTAKWVFGCYRSCRYSRERSSQNLKVISFIFQSSPYLKDAERFRRWRLGQTGFPFVDAGMRQLRRTGYMSHLHRQCCAAFLARDLQLDWRLGAETFEACLRTK